MELFLKYVLSPLLAAIFVNGLVWIKDRNNDKTKHLEGITFEQLTSVYNQLFILYHQHNSSLKVGSEERISGVTDDGQEQTYKIPYIKETKLWDEVIEEVREVIYPNFHLLIRKDILNWNDFLREERKTPEREEDIYDSYIAFKTFFVGVSNSYVKLYNRYHLETNRVKKTRKKAYKKKKKNIKKNPFYSKEQKRRKLFQLKRKEEERQKEIL